MDDSDIPIDIHTSKLMEWLISRRHVPQDWSKRILTVREKINEAIKDMPEDKEITSLLTGTYINYFHCKKIIEMLNKIEVSSKNLFGQYTSKRMRDWVEIIKLYEKDNIYLGEAASLLQRNVNYEVPALRKQIAKASVLKSEYEKKESTYEKMAETAMKDFNATCKSLGIKGTKIKTELIEKAENFSQMCSKIVREIKAIKPAIDFYLNVYKSLLESKKHPLEILEYIIKNGNTTVYQWKYKKVPESIETLKLLPEEEDEKEKVTDNVIDFGIEDEINFDDNIDWGISTIESDEKENDNKIEIAVKEENKNVARGEEAHTILGHLDTKNLILNDILEVEAFLKIRIHEMSSESDGLSLTMLPESMQMHDVKTLKEFLEKVQTVKQSLTDSSFLHYLNITTNQKYVNQLAEKLKQKLGGYEKLMASKECVKSQRADIIKEAEAIKPKVDLLIKKSKELQSLIEDDISKKYKGRPVNLIAGASIL